MSSLIGKISNSELEVLKLLWQAERSMTITEIRNILSANTEWEMSTIKMLVRTCTVCLEAAHARKKGNSKKGL